MTDTVAIVAARGGSKGIPKKNIYNFCGKPLIAWSILQAIQSEKVDSVWVTSDSDEILQISSDYGANPIKRPETLATDHCTSESAWLHALEYIETKQNIDLCVALQATSPLRHPQDISRAIEEYFLQGCDSLFSAAILEDFLIWRKENNVLKSINYDYKNRGRRQDRKSEYVENGSFYIFSPGVLKSGNRLAGSIGMHCMDFWKSFEIDTIEDMQMCEIFFLQHKLGSLFKTKESVK